MPRKYIIKMVTDELSFNQKNNEISFQILTVTKGGHISTYKALVSYRLNSDRGGGEREGTGIPGKSDSVWA